MSFELSWYLENRVILLTSQADNSDDNLLDVDQQVIHYIDQSSAPLVHLIMDQRNAPPPSSSKAASQIKLATQLKWPKHPKYGWAIMIGPTNSLQRFVIAVATNFFKVRQRTFDTVDEGLDFLNDIDSSLPALRDNKLNKAS
jgi:hypothetical protein